MLIKIEKTRLFINEIQTLIMILSLPIYPMEDEKGIIIV